MGSPESPFVQLAEAIFPANPFLLKSKIGKRKPWKTHPSRQTFGNLFYPINLGSPENEPLEEQKKNDLGKHHFQLPAISFRGCMFIESSMRTYVSFKF